VESPLEEAQRIASEFLFARANAQEEDFSFAIDVSVTSETYDEAQGKLELALSATELNWVYHDFDDD
jgi:hypothetical protein